jgi:hypothetical protein
MNPIRIVRHHLCAVSYLGSFNAVDFVRSTLARFVASGCKTLPACIIQTIAYESNGSIESLDYIQS